MADAVRITYDPEGDILFVTFGAPTPSTGYQISDQILVRLHPASRQATGLTILNYSAHARSGLSIPLRATQDMEPAPDLLAVLGSPPVNRFLQICQDARGSHAIILQPGLAEAVAA